MFFKQFPNTEYDLRENNRPIIIKDIFRHVDVNEIFAEDVINYTYYDVLEGERPDQVSQNLYGTPDYYWTFFIVNESLKNGLTDWPKDPTTLENEFALEFDPYGAIVCLPEIEPSLIFNDITRDDLGNIDTSPSVIPEPRIANTFSGYDLSLADLRVKRNNLLAETDFHALSDNTLSTEMATYRQNLRDITDGLDTVAKVNAVSMPTKP